MEEGRELREGDIEAIRRKAKLEGRPIKSTIIFDGDKKIHYDENKGRVKITEEY